MIKERLEENLRQALVKLGGSLGNLSLETGDLEDLKLERPRNQEFGDYAVNVSPLAKTLKMPPPKIAEMLLETLSNGDVKTNIVGSFINFKLAHSAMADALVSLVTTAEPGKNDSLSDQSVLLEYVSANPTGPLHIGHGRWAALGDSLARIFRHCGAVVTPEFYINDAGEQMDKIGRSVFIRALELAKCDVSHLGDPPYPGEYVIDLAADVLKDPAQKEKILAEATSETPQYKWLIPDLKNLLLKQQQDLLGRLGVDFEAWFSEQDLLHERGLVAEVLIKLRASGFSYEQDGALWLRSSEFGDEKDRVLIKADGNYTYLAADIAYHDHKYSREDDDGKPQYNKFINIWGADHHGYIPRMKAAIEALGWPVEQFEVLLGQLVNLIVDGEKTRMGKRKKMLMLEDVVDEVGVDATRFWMVSKSSDSALDFDVALAASATEENPVFYVQYAHARCSGIIRNAIQESINTNTGEKVQPVMSPKELEKFCENLSADKLGPLFNSLADDPRALAAVNQLILRMDGFSDMVADAARMRTPHLIARYMMDLAADFHSFYNACRILTPDAELTKSRLMLVVALRKVLSTGLILLGVSAPEKM